MQCGAALGLGLGLVLVLVLVLGLGAGGCRLRKDDFKGDVARIFSRRNSDADCTVL